MNASNASMESTKRPVSRYRWFLSVSLPFVDPWSLRSTDTVSFSKPARDDDAMAAALEARVAPRARFAAVAERVEANVAECGNLAEAWSDRMEREPLRRLSYEAVQSYGAVCDNRRVQCSELQEKPE